MYIDFDRSRFTEQRAVRRPSGLGDDRYVWVTCVLRLAHLHMYTCTPHSSKIIITHQQPYSTEAASSKDILQVQRSLVELAEKLDVLVGEQRMIRHRYEWQLQHAVCCWFWMCTCGCTAHVYVGALCMCTSVCTAIHERVPTKHLRLLRYTHVHERCCVP